jgi:hypothetical protein
MFAAPIPGQSLTTPPKNYAWERPPEIADPEQAMQFYLSKLSNPKTLSAVLDGLEVSGMDISSMTKGIIRSGVAEGVHNLDVAMLVAPVVHEFIKQAANSVGLEVDDGFENKAENEARKQAVISARARKMLASMGAKPKEVAQEISTEETPVEETFVEEAPVKRGLMARGDME